jgi:hypothetical protein
MDWHIYDIKMIKADVSILIKMTYLSELYGP